jgi:hypothetical protein
MPQFPPNGPWPLVTQHRNSRVCRSDAERMQTVWRSSSMGCPRDRSTAAQNLPAAAPCGTVRHSKPLLRRAIWDAAAAWRSGRSTRPAGLSSKRDHHGPPGVCARGHRARADRARQRIPREQVEGPARCKIMRLPPGLAFRTKGQLAIAPATRSAPAGAVSVLSGPARQQAGQVLAEPPPLRPVRTSLPRRVDRRALRPLPG